MDDSMASSGDTPVTTRCKVGRVIKEYGLSGFGAELEERWTAEEERASLRELADELNRELLRAAASEAGRDFLAEEVASFYRVLTNEDASEGERTEIRRVLEREGVDVDSLLDDFVSHQAVHTYLREYRDVTPPERETVTPEGTATTLQQLRERTRRVTEEKVDQLRVADRLSVGEFEVLVDIRVLCEDCGADMTIDSLLRDGGCDCGNLS